MAAPYADPQYAPIGLEFFTISCSVSTSTSAVLAGVGPFRGLFMKTSTSFTAVGFNNESLAIDNLAKNATLWVQGCFISVIATATSIFGLR